MQLENVEMAICKKEDIEEFANSMKTDSEVPYKYFKLIETPETEKQKDDLAEILAFARSKGVSLINATGAPIQPEMLF